MISTKPSQQLAVHVEDGSLIDDSLPTVAKECDRVGLGVVAKSARSTILRWSLRREWSDC